MVDILGQVVVTYSNRVAVSALSRIRVTTTYVETNVKMNIDSLSNGFM